MKLDSKYGLVFKRLRKQRGFNLTSFTDYCVFPSMLCKFENGKNMIRLDKLYVTLRKMSITLAEYEGFLNNHKLSHQKQLVEETFTALIYQKYENLSDIYIKALKLKEKVYSIAVKAQYQKISITESEEFCDYFEDIELWRCIDLYSLYLLIDLLKPQQISYILEGFFCQGYFASLLNSVEHRIIISKVVSRAALFLSFKGGDKELSQHLLNYIKPESYTHTMHTKTLYKFVKGCWDNKFINSEEGKEEMKRALSIFETVGSPEVANYYLDLYVKYKNLNG